MRFFKEGSATPVIYKEAIDHMEAEMYCNFRSRKKMKYLILAGILLMILSLAGVLFRYYVAGLSGFTLSIFLIIHSFLKWRDFNMYFCFSAYTYDQLKKEYLELYDKNEATL